MSLFGTGRREGILAVLLLVALALVQHAPGVMFGNSRGAFDARPAVEGHALPVPHGAEAATNQVVFAPAMQQAGAVLRDGSLPTWNPYARFGEPFSASGAPLLYPPFWLLMLDGGARWLDLLMLAHAVLACVLTYRMVRAFGLSRYVGFLAGGLYGLGWFLVTAFDRLPEAAAAAWLPAIVTASWRLAFARVRTPAAIRLALAVSVPFLTGGIGTATCGALLGVVCGIAGLLAIDRDDRRPVAVAHVGAALLVLLCTAPTWLDALQNGPAYATRGVDTRPGLQVAGLAGLVVPDLFGELGQDEPPIVAAANPGADSLELPLYPGAITLFVALLGLMRPKRTRLGLFWLVVAGGTLVLALDGPIGSFARWLLPFEAARPGALLAVFHLATVLLVALGLENFFDAPRARRFAMPIAIGIVGTTSLVTLTLALLTPQTLGAMAARLVDGGDAGELAALAAHVARRSIAPAVASLAIAATFVVWRRLGILRFKAALATVALGELLVLAFLHVPRGAQPSDDSLAARTPADGLRMVRVGDDRMPPGGWIAGVDGVRVVDTDGDRILDRTARYLETVEPGAVRMHARSRIGPFHGSVLYGDAMLARASIGTALSGRAPDIDTFVPMTAAPGAAGSVGGLVPYVAATTRPRLRLVHDVHPVPDRNAAARVLRAGGFRELDTIVLEDPAPDFTCARPAKATEVTIVEDRADHVHARVDLGDGRGYLVLADALAPGWSARVDGQPVRIHAADLAFRAVALREGVHEVVFEYRALSASLGLALGAAGLTVAGLLLVLARVLRPGQA